MQLRYLIIEQKEIQKKRRNDKEKKNVEQIQYPL